MGTPAAQAREPEPGDTPTCVLLVAVDQVLACYVAQLPLMIRQCWYALVSDGVLVKGERTYKRLGEVLGMARR